MTGQLFVGKERALRFRVTASVLNRTGRQISAGLMLLALSFLGGCWGITGESLSPEKGFIDPSEVSVTTKAKTPLLVPVLDKIAPDYEETEEIFTQATDVKPEDLQIPNGDYPIGVSDLITVSITDLVSPGVETNRQVRVSETGKISLPLIGQVQAEGLTEAQLEQEIIAAYRDQQIIQNAQVSVSVVVAQSRTFSILGSVQQAGQYAIPRNDFRLLDALVSARDLTVDVDIRGNKGIDTIFVLRRIRPEGWPTTQPSGMTPRNGSSGPSSTPADLLAPPGTRTAPATEPGAKQMMLMQTAGMGASANAPTTEPTTGPSARGAAANSSEPEGRYIIGPDGKPTFVGGTEPAAPPTPDSTTGVAPAPAPSVPPPQNQEMVDINGPKIPPNKYLPTTNFVFNDLRSPLDTRIIRVPVAALKQGDLRYNIVIRPDDMIIVRPPTQGEYYMGGHVNRVGVYSLTARKITLTQAVISAGMLDQLAIPGRAQIIRRIGADHQCFVRVDLEKIFAGEQPDIFLKPDDQVLVGTNIWAPFLAAIRGGFRMTYGFGFLYDRNFAYNNTQQNL